MALNGWGNDRTSWLLLSFSVVVILLTSGCATQDDEKALEKRVTAIEEKQRAKDNADSDRQDKLEHCVNIEADAVYWDYVKLNGKPVSGEPGTYTATQYHWDHAEKMKRDKVEECKLLYGPR